MSTAPRRVVVTGLGVVDPFADTAAASAGTPGGAARFFERIAHGDSAVALYQSPQVPRDIVVPGVYCTHFDGAATLGPNLASMMERFAQMGCAAAFDAWADAGLPRLEPGAHPLQAAERGICWGTALGGLMTFEHAYHSFWQAGRERLAPSSVVMGMNNAATAHLSIQLGLGNAALTYSVACASANTAIGEAFRRIRDGHARLMVAGGSDATLAYAVVRAWEALRVLAPGDAKTAPQACKPFHAQRGGLVLGEGAAALVLEDAEHAAQRGARIYAEVAGYGCNADHSHLVRPNAAGQAAALRLALAEAQLAPHDIGYVNAHGTATREGDPTEIRALREVFGDHAAQLPVSATKAQHGHLLGAAGAIETLITVLALYHDCLPPTAHLPPDAVDPACQGVDHICGAARRGLGTRAALSNSFAFGGSNAVLALRHAR